MSMLKAHASLSSLMILFVGIDCCYLRLLVIIITCDLRSSVYDLGFFIRGSRG